MKVLKFERQVRRDYESRDSYPSICGSLWLIYDRHYSGHLFGPSVVEG